MLNAKHVIVLAGAGASANNLYNGKPVCDYASIKDNPIHQGLRYYDLMHHKTLLENRDLFWSFYKEHASILTSAEPCSAYRQLFQLIGKKSHFIATTNVDNAFWKVGFRNVYELHGNLNMYQCHCVNRDNQKVARYRENWWENHLAMPVCRICRHRIRPAVLLFEDNVGWSYTDESTRQHHAFWNFIDQEVVDGPVVIYEIGCGTLVPTLRKWGKDIMEVLEKRGIHVWYERITLDHPSLNDHDFVTPTAHVRATFDEWVSRHVATMD